MMCTYANAVLQKFSNCCNKMTSHSDNTIVQTGILLHMDTKVKNQKVKLMLSIQCIFTDIHRHYS